MSVTCLVLHEPFVVLVCSNVVVVSCLLLIWYYVGYLWYCMSLSLRPLQLHISLPYYCTSHTLLPIFLPILPYKWYNPHITTQHKRYTTTQIIQSSSYYTDETLLLLLAAPWRAVRMSLWLLAVSNLRRLPGRPLTAPPIKIFSKKQKIALVARASFEFHLYIQLRLYRTRCVSNMLDCFSNVSVREICVSHLQQLEGSREMGASVGRH